MRLLINQSPGYLFIDIANAISKYDKVVLICNSKRDLKRLNSNVKIIHIKPYDKSSLFKRLTSWVVSSIQIWWIIITRYNKDELLFSSNPPLASLLSFFLPNKHISYLVYDIYPDVLISGKIIKKDNVIGRIWSKINKKIYSRADHIYTLSEGMANCLSKYINREKIEIVPCWPDTSVLFHVDKKDNSFIKKYNLEGKFIVLYSGNLGYTHRVESIVYAAERLKQYKNIHFVMIGEGGKKDLIRRMVTNAKLCNFTLLPYQPIDILPYSLGAADIAVVTLDISASQLSVPSKTFNLLYLGKTILCIGSDNSELGKLVNKYSIGKVCSPDDIDSIVSFIKEMSINADELNKFNHNSRELSNQFSVDNSMKFI